MAWLLALQPMIGAYAASAMANAPVAMECRGVVLDPGAPDQDAPAGGQHSQKCCLAYAPTAAPPPEAATELAAPSVFSATAAPRIESPFVARAGLGPQSARAPPL